jgi:hypothetical protein
MGAIRGLVVLVACCAVAGCMTYAGIPDGGKPAAGSSKAPSTLHYSIEGSSLFAGPNAIRSVLAAEAPYQAVGAAEKPPVSGDYLSVKIVQNPPTAPALLFGYISYATLTILPFWSTNDGATLTFTLYREGKQALVREYVLQRKLFVWILMLPLVWVNLITPSEEEAFAASARDFLAAMRK